MRKTFATLRILSGASILFCGFLSGCSLFGPSEDIAATVYKSPAGLLSPAEKLAKGQIDWPSAYTPEAESAHRVEKAGQTQYQIDIVRVDRSCERSGDALIVKTSVDGRILIGPAGSAGSYSAPLRLFLRDDINNKILSEKSYTASGSITSGQTATSFSITTTFTVPIQPQRGGEGYTIIASMSARKGER